MKSKLQQIVPDYKDKTFELEQLSTKELYKYIEKRSDLKDRVAKNLDAQIQRNFEESVPSEQEID